MLAAEALKRGYKIFITLYQVMSQLNAFMAITKGLQNFKSLQYPPPQKSKAVVPNCRFA